MTAEGDISQPQNVADANQPIDGLNSLTLARADFGTDVPITRAPADPYVNNTAGDQTQRRVRATQDNAFVPPGDAAGPGRDRYFDPNAANRPAWRNNPFARGGTDFRRQGDPLPQGDQTQNGPRPRVVPPRQDGPARQVIPPNQLGAENELPAEFTGDEFDSEFGTPEQLDARLTPGVMPADSRVPGGGIPAYTGMGFNFTNNFYSVGERVPLIINGDITPVPRGVEGVPAIRLQNSFPGVQNFFGVPLNGDPALRGSAPLRPGYVAPDSGNSLPALRESALPAATNLAGRVVSETESRRAAIGPAGGERVVQGPASLGEQIAQIPASDNRRATIGPAGGEQTAQAIVKPANNAVIAAAPERTVVRPANETVVATNEPGALTNVTNLAPIGPDRLANSAGPQRPGTTTLDNQIGGPLYTGSGLLTPIDQRTQNRAEQTTLGLINETYRWRTGVTAAGAYWGSLLAPSAYKFTEKPFSRTLIPGNVARNAIRDPAGAVLGVTVYEAGAGLMNWNNPDWNSSSRAAGLTFPAGVMAYRALMNNPSLSHVRGGFLAMGVGAATVAGTYALDSVLPAARDTSWGTHSGFDDVAMAGGLAAATYLQPAHLGRFLPAALSNVSGGLWKAGLIAGAYVLGNVAESAYNWAFPGTAALASHARAGLDRDASERTAASLTEARQRFSNLSDSQWSAAQAELVSHKAKVDAMTHDRDGLANMAVADRRLLVLAGAVGENYLNRGTHVIGQGHTYLSRGTDLDLNSQALTNLMTAKETGLRLIRKYNENVVGDRLNGTTVNRTQEVAALQTEMQRIQGLMERVYRPHDYEAAMPEFVNYARDNGTRFFESFVTHNSTMAQRYEQDMRTRGLWDNPNYSEWRSVVGKMHRDRAFALLAVAQNALNLNNGALAVEALRGQQRSNAPNENARAALIAAIQNFTNNPGQKTEAERINLERVKAIYQRLEQQVRQRFPHLYPTNS